MSYTRIQSVQMVVNMCVRIVKEDKKKIDRKREGEWELFIYYKGMDGYAVKYKCT